MTPANSGNAFTQVVESGGGFWRCKTFTDAQIVRPSRIACGRKVVPVQAPACVVPLRVVPGPREVDLVKLRIDGSLSFEPSSPPEWTRHLGLREQTQRFEALLTRR